MLADAVIARYAIGVPDNYLPGLRNGMVVRRDDLDLLALAPNRPIVGLPTESVGVGPSGELPVYELHALGGVQPGDSAAHVG